MDGNDLLAVFATTKKAREIAAKNNEPVLIESMSYRVGHHSTSDDSSAYRPKEEVASWSNDMNNPISRFRKYLEKRKIWNEDHEKRIREDLRKEILSSFDKAERKKKPSLEKLFGNVYNEKPWHLQEQQNDLERIIKEYPGVYPVEDYEKP